VDAACPAVAVEARGRSVCRRELPWPPDLTSRTCFFPVIELMDVSCSSDVVFCFLEDRGRCHAIAVACHRIENASLLL
jgi:hypothetical protein